MKNLELKVIPPFVFAIALVFMWSIATFSPTFYVDLAVYISILFFSLGCIVGLIAVIQLWKYKTTIHPHELDKSSYLVTNGIYGFTRNPMYLGLLLFLIAWGFYLRNIPSFFICIIFVFYITRFQIKPEEKALESIFLNGFIQYKNIVRRWI